MKKEPLTKGGFIFDAPVSHQLTRASFVWATLWDIACSICENYKTLNEVSLMNRIIYGLVAVVFRAIL
jgi:autoinducer 2 (AI-2) kinase